MAGNTYWELLRHPNWQRKRLRIMELSGFECEKCGADDKTLNVHHSYYEKGKAPWEYPDESLHCLCEDCHQAAQDVMTALNRQIGKVWLGGHEELLGYTLAMAAEEPPPNDANPVLDVFSHGVALGIADYHHLRVEDVIQNVIDGTLDHCRLREISGRARQFRAQRWGKDDIYCQLPGGFTPEKQEWIKTHKAELLWLLGFGDAPEKDQSK